MAILPAIPTPVADLGALTIVATALKLRVEALGAQVAVPVPVLTAQAFATLDLSGLPSSNPGGGRPWLNAGVLTVGP